MPVASAILVRAPGEDGKPVVRPYTPLAGDDKGHFDLLVKVYEQGKMSQHIHGLKPGQTLDVKGPLPKIAYAPNKWKSIGMIAGGTGRAFLRRVLLFFRFGFCFIFLFLLRCFALSGFCLPTISCSMMWSIALRFQIV